MPVYVISRPVSSLHSARHTTTNGRPVSRRTPCPRLPPSPISSPTALALDAARHDLGSPVVVNSAWRSDRYNRAVGGAPQSFHKTFLAADTAPANPALLGRYYRILRGLRDGGEWRGGLGGYKTFVHVDTGTSYNRDWGVQL